MPDREMSDGKIAPLRRLKLAYHGAEDGTESTGDLVTSKDELLADGATPKDLLWLAERKYATHLLDVTPAGQRTRQFRATSARRLLENSCFALTYAGSVYVDLNVFEHLDANRQRGPVASDRPAHTQSIVARTTQREGSGADGASEGDARTASSANWTPIGGKASGRALPTWRAVHGELYFRGELVRKRGRKLAKLEEHLLCAFDLAEWPLAILNPFQDDPVMAEQRVKDAVRRLNKSLLRDSLRFHVVGTGAIVSWEDLGDAATRAAMPITTADELAE